MTTIILVDDHPVIRLGLQALLESEPDFKIVGEAHDEIEAMQAVRSLRPDIIVVDMMIGGINGIEVARQVSRDFPDIGIIVFSALGNEHYILEALRAGAKAYVLKESPLDELVHALREVARGHRYFSPAVLDRTIDVYLQTVQGSPSQLYDSLTARERQVLQLSVDGLTSSEIAKRLYLSKRTVEAHRANMMHKLGLRNQRELICYAIQKGILVPERTGETVRIASGLQPSLAAAR